MHSASMIACQKSDAGWNPLGSDGSIWHRAARVYDPMTWRSLLFGSQRQGCPAAVRRHLLASFRSKGTALQNRLDLSVPLKA